jgi:hypothetical protein
MSTLQVPHSPLLLRTFLLLAKPPWWRSLVLLVLLALSSALYIMLIGVVPQREELTVPFVHIWMVSFLPYLTACVFVLATKPFSGRWRWVELAIILLGALILRLLLLPLPPVAGISRDAWRYVWCARVLLQGYSPYVHAPGEEIFLPLRDFIFTNMRFRNVPTIYLPVAQGVYALSYLLAPSNVIALKGIFLLCDLVTCGALTWLLARKGLDPRHVIIYAWCPLPIVEYALQGHVDPLTIMFTVLAVLCSTSPRRGARVLTGILIGLGALTKIYPIILLVAVVRRRDWALLIACAATIVVTYLPFLIMGHGQVLGFLPTYINEQGDNAGVVQWVVRWISTYLSLTVASTLVLEYVVDLVVASTMALLVWLLRLRERISMEAAIVLLIGTVFAVSSHVFPWYVPALLPWVTILVGPLWVARRPSGKGLAIVMAWYFTGTTVLAYLFGNPSGWHVYYMLVYDVVLIGLGAAVVMRVLSVRTIPVARGA